MANAPREQVRLTRPFVTTSNTAIQKSDIIPLAESDGTIKVSNYGKVSSTVTAIALDDNGEQKISLWGNVSSTPTAVEVESSGRLMAVAYGKDSGGNEDPLRTNANQQLQVEHIDEWQPVFVDGATIDTGGVTVYTVPASTIAEIYVDFANVQGTDSAIDFHLIGSGDSAAGSNQILDAYTITANDLPTRLGPYYLEAGGTVYAIDTANDDYINCQPTVRTKAA